MITEQHEYLHSYFTDDEKTTILVYWVDPEEKSIEEEYIEAKEGDEAYEHLLTFVDIDKIHENTFKHIKEEIEAMDEHILKIGKEKGVIYDFDNVNTKMYEGLFKTLFNFDPESDGAKETLFLYKLALFENEVISKSKNRELKSKVRKAKTIMEATKFAIELFESETTSQDT